jgi:hypothetical protein
METKFRAFNSGFFWLFSAFSEKLVSIVPFPQAAR